MVPDPQTSIVGFEYFVWEGDEFWSMDLPTVLATIPTGFHLATFSELEALMNSMGGVVGTFAADCAIAGGNCDGVTDKAYIFAHVGAVGDHGAHA